MARAAGFKTYRFGTDLVNLIEARMAQDHRRGSVNGYIEEVLYNWVNNVVIDWERERPRLLLELREQTKGRVVNAVRVRSLVDEHDEGKRKAAS